MHTLRNATATGLIVVAALLWASTEGNAADLRYYPRVDEGTNVILYGDIATGDADALDRMIRASNGKGELVHTIFLYSPGGSASEGMLLGEVIRKHRLHTFSPRYGATCIDTLPNFDWDTMFGDKSRMARASRDVNCVCASACAIAWLGGGERIGAPGFHRVYVVDENTELSFGQQEALLGGSRSELESYLQTMRAPSWLLDRIFSTGSEALYFLNDEEERAMEIDPIYAEYVTSRCGPGLSYEQQNKWLELVEKRYRYAPGLDETESLLFDALNAVSERRNSCESIAHRAAVEEVQHLGTQ